MASGMVQWRLESACECKALANVASWISTVALRPACCRACSVRCARSRVQITNQHVQIQDLTQLKIAQLNITQTSRVTIQKPGTHRARACLAGPCVARKHQAPAAKASCHKPAGVGAMLHPHTRQAGQMARCEGLPPDGSAPMACVHGGNNNWSAKRWTRQGQSCTEVLRQLGSACGLQNALNCNT